MSAELHVVLIEGLAMAIKELALAVLQVVFDGGAAETDERTGCVTSVAAGIDGCVTSEVAGTDERTGCVTGISDRGIGDAETVEDMEEPWTEAIERFIE